MELIHINYLPKKKQILLLLLGLVNGKIIGIESSQVNDYDRNLIIANKAALSGMDVPSKVAWIRDKCKASYNKGYRSISVANAQILQKFPLS